jgi:hypothetical protein
MMDNSNIPIIRTGFFTKEFKVIDHLCFYKNNINTIERDPLINLPELKWINLFGNQLDMTA